MILILADTADRDTEPVVEGAVADGDVGTVGFCGDGIIAVHDGPAGERDIMREECVGAVSVRCGEAG